MDICAKIEDLKDIELNYLPVYNDRYIKTKIRTYRDRVYTNFRVVQMCQKIIQNVNLLHSFLLILYLYTKTNITSMNISAQFRENIFEH